MSQAGRSQVGRSNQNMKTRTKKADKLAELDWNDQSFQAKGKQVMGAPSHQQKTDDVILDKKRERARDRSEWV